ncbi:RNA polymerase sigma-70 factor [Carboxylicivirga linearis]|uniref:RNA polymerase sigma-70 factor n=1 Tax=Carboxylicivirga linearis TaxID=1628157 RepID=A0ABS5K0N1_9BACT|nr:RNA polymerase sigma-70 factor [Carboxylicivirga linearis]MBS2100673.1 RNA polymerase sigma-70 factor [Carboxylicivirga linearis]
MNKSKHLSDIFLVDQLHVGDMNSFDLIFEKYGNRLYAFAISYLKSNEEAEELVQDVFLKLWENRAKLNRESSLKSYLFTIAYHKMCNLFRQKEQHNKYILSEKVQDEKSVNLEEQIEFKEALNQIDQIIEELPLRQKEIFIKSRKEGKSSKQIAEELQISPATVDNQISAALKYLRKHIPEANIGLILYFFLFL